MRENIIIRSFVFACEDHGAFLTSPSFGIWPSGIWGFGVVVWLDIGERGRNDKILLPISHGFFNRATAMMFHFESLVLASRVLWYNEFVRKRGFGCQ